MVRICFVCLGNICRSPTAEGIMLQMIQDAGLAKRFEVDSAGTAAYHAGERADPRSIATARAHGVELTSVARKFERADFDAFDHVVAMDKQNLAALAKLAPSRAARDKLRLLRSFDADSPDGADVPDPYYGQGDGFEQVYRICEAACRGLLGALLAGPAP